MITPNHRRKSEGSHSWSYRSRSSHYRDLRGLWRSNGPGAGFAGLDARGESGGRTGHRYLGHFFIRRLGRRLGWSLSLQRRDLVEGVDWIWSGPYPRLGENSL